MSHPYPYGYDPNQEHHQQQPQQLVPPQPQPIQQFDRPTLPRQESGHSLHPSDGSPSTMSLSQFVTPLDNRQYTPYPPGMYYSEPSSSNPSYQLNTPAPNIHFYPPVPPGHDALPHDRSGPSMSLDLPPQFPFVPHLMGQMPMEYMPIHDMPPQGLHPGSPYVTPLGMPSMASGSGSSSQGMTDYFPPFGTSPAHVGQPIPAFSPTWSSAPPAGTKSTKASTSKAEKAGHAAKTSRQQFTACGACRHRRVKCDLKDRQDQAEKAANEGGSKGPGPHRTNAAAAAARRKKVTCTNCQERGTNCVDEYAPIKAAKQLRRGKRISEIEMLYGRAGGNASTSNLEESSSDTSKSPGKPFIKEEFTIPELSKAFFDSAFFRRFQIQRPILDPTEFVNRYLSVNPPYAAAMGPEGAILCHVLYAWAVSYGVDEHGRLDVPEGGDAPAGLVDLMKHNEGEIKREQDRQRRRAAMAQILEVILRRIDQCGVMRKPSWDGVRALLLILPLTDGISTPVERLSMYEAAISQVFTLCSHIGVGYDGAPSATHGANGGIDHTGALNTHLVRIRIYWYAFVHEGITTGLKGGRLHLDDEDLDTMQDSLDDRSMVSNSTPLRAAAKFATAPINLALACRLINKALTGPSAKRRQHVDPNLVKGAWEALESCWEEFDSLKLSSPVQAYSTPDEVIRFSDGWKIFLFEAQNVIRKSLEDRLAKLTSFGGASGAYIVDPQISLSNEAVNLQHLLDIARSKCEVKTRQILEIVRMHVGTRFFEWDASLVRDGTYYAAMLHAKAGGSDEDIALCIQALNELRWAHAKAWERSTDLRNEWASSRPARHVQGWEPGPSDLNAGYYNLGSIPETYTVDGNSSLSGSGSPYTAPGTISIVDTSVVAPGPPSLAQGLYIPSQGPPGTHGYGMYGTNTGPPPLDVLIHSVPPPLGGPPVHQPYPVQGQGHYVLQPDGSQMFVPY